MEKPPAPDAAPTQPIETGADSRPSFVRRHPFGLGIAGGAIAVVLISGLTAWGVDAALASSAQPTSAAAPATVTSPGATAPKVNAPKHSLDGRTLVRGTIASIDASSWSITTRSGTTITVTVDGSTSYGTKKAPASATDFAAGDPVLVVERGGAAVRVVAPRAAGAVTPAPSATPNS